MSRSAAARSRWRLVDSSASWIAGRAGMAGMPHGRADEDQPADERRVAAGDLQEPLQGQAPRGERDRRAVRDQGRQEHRLQAAGMEQGA